MSEPLVATTDTRVEIVEERTVEEDRGGENRGGENRGERTVEKTVEERTVEERTVERTAPLEEVVVAQVVDTTEIPDPRSIPALALAQRASRSTMTDTMRKRDQLLVSGRVLDETGEPVTGATVSLENSTSGTVTDMDGMFRLSVPKGEKGSLIAGTSA